MSSKTEGQHTAEFLVSEAAGTRSRDKVTVTVPADTTFQAGSVLGKITSSGKYALYDNGFSDGREVAAAVLYDTHVNADPSNAADVEATVINVDAEVRSADLQWADELNDATAGLADLLALGIKAR